MKKNAGTPKKRYTRKKTAGKTAPLRGKQAKKSAGFMRAVKLFGTLALISILISLAVILFHSNFIKLNDPGITGDVSADYETDTPPTGSVPPEKNDGVTVQVTAPAVETGTGGQSVSDNTRRNTGQSAQSQANDVMSNPAGAGQNTTVQPNMNQNTTAPSAVTAQPPASVNGGSTQTIAVSSQRPVESLGALVFVIDDAGNNLNELEPFLRIPYPLTIAVLPGLPYSAEAARRIRAAGKEVILHQPMEAVGGQNPGPGAVYSGMSDIEIRSILKRNLDEIGPVAGMNNHQGSLITADRELMEVILKFCAENNLFFLDSRTTADTVIPAAAGRLGVKITERDTFIDNEQDRASMINYINTGLERAGKNGLSVMIGHTWSPLLGPLLAERLASFTAQGYSIKTVSGIIK